jgi:hypothetical protein
MRRQEVFGHTYAIHLRRRGDLERVFLPKDHLLASAGILPVYYWLTRDLDEAQQSVDREFRVNFERQRRLNRTLLKKNPDGKRIDSQLVEFDNYNRSTNDQASHTGRLRILRARIESDVQTGALTNRSTRPRTSFEAR